VDLFCGELRCVSDDINRGVARMDAFKWQPGARDEEADRLDKFREYYKRRFLGAEP
jgi:hypothetical protein